MDRTPTRPTAKAPAATFTGDVYVTPIASPNAPSRLVASTVRFTPGARTNWHSHSVGQTLAVTEGIGFVATRGGDVVRVVPGDTVWAPAGEEHWHGATSENQMCHIAMLEVNEDGSDPTTWLEPVTDEQYQAAHQH